MNPRSKRPSRFSPLWFLLPTALGGCNLLAGIEEGTLGVCPDGTLQGRASCTHDCPPPWQYDDPATGHCYFHESDARNWKTARQLCLDMGGDLATISSASELSLVSAASPLDTWIGGTDLLTEGLFVWANAEPWEFAPWIDGAPIDADGKQDCVALEGAEGGEPGFDDRPCTDKRDFLCESVPR